MWILLFLATMASAAPAISDAQMAKLVDGIDKIQSKHVPGPALCAALKIGKRTDPKYSYHYPYRAQTGADMFRHVFGRSKETGDFLLVRETSSHIQYFHADAELKLIAAASYKLRVGEDPQALRDEEAAKIYGEEIAVWAQWAGGKRSSN